MCASITAKHNVLPSELLSRCSSNTSYKSSASGQSGSQPTSGVASALGSRFSSLSAAYRREPEPKAGPTQTIREIAAQSQLPNVNGTRPPGTNLQDLFTQQNNGRSPVAPPPPPSPPPAAQVNPPSVSPSAANPKPSSSAPAPQVPSGARVVSPTTQRTLPPPIMPKPEVCRPDTRPPQSPIASNTLAAAAAALYAQRVKPATAAQAAPRVRTNISAVGPAAPQTKTDTPEESSGSGNTVVGLSNRRGPLDPRPLAVTGSKPRPVTPDSDAEGFMSQQSAEDGPRTSAFFVMEDSAYKDACAPPPFTGHDSPRRADRAGHTCGRADSSADVERSDSPDTGNGQGALSSRCSSHYYSAVLNSAKASPMASAPLPHETPRSPLYSSGEATAHERETLAASVRVASDEHVKYLQLMEVQQLAEWATIKSQIGAMLLEDRRHYEGVKFTPTAKLDDKQMREKTDPFHGNLTGGLCVALVRRDRHLLQQPVYFAFWTDFFNSAVRCVALENEPLRFVHGASKHTVFQGEYPHFLGAIAAVHDEASGELRHLVVIESCAHQLARQRLGAQCAGSSPEDEQRVHRQGGTVADAAEKQTGPHRISILVLRGADGQSDSDGLRFEPHCSIRLGDADVGCHTNACAIGARVFASYSHSRFVFRLDVHPSGDGLDLRHVDVGSNVRSLASDPKLHVVAALLLDGSLCVLNETLVPLTKYAIRAGEVPFIRRLQQVSIEPKLIAFMRLGLRHRPCVLVVFHHKMKAAQAAAENRARNGKDSDNSFDSISVYDVLSGEWLSRLSPEELKPLAALCVFPSEKTRTVPAASAAASGASDRGFLVSYLECLSVRTFYERDANSSQTATATPFINAQKTQNNNHIYQM